MTIRSSETTREALNFHFSDYITVKPSHVKKIDIGFLIWFIGFVEGDGSFIVSNVKSKNRKRLFFCINQKDAKLLFKIKKKLGFGNVLAYKQNNQTYYRYSTSSFPNVRKLIHLFNGNLLLDKVNFRFQKWVHEYNLHIALVDSTQNRILIKNRKPSLDLKSSWLAGFIDADAGFYARLTKQNSGNYRLKMKFYITQKQELETLNKIKYLFMADPLNELSTLQKQKNEFSDRGLSELYIYHFKSDYYRLEMTKASHLFNLIDYLTNYPLQGNKKIVFIRWKRIFQNKSQILVKNQIEPSSKSFLRFQRLVDAVQNEKN